jgi:hypothetical protein
MSDSPVDFRFPPSVPKVTLKKVTQLFDSLFGVEISENTGKP